MTTSNWPLVLVDDIGLDRRTPGACFFCRQKIGQPHGLTCVTISRRVKMRYTFEVDVTVPYTQTKAELLERHKNGWCASNGVDEVVIASRAAGCACSMFSSEFIAEGSMEPIQQPGRAAAGLPVQPWPFRAGFPRFLN